MEIFRDDLVAVAKKVFDESKDIEIVISKLKSKGANQIQTTQALCRGLGLKLGEADKYVLESPSWSDKLDFNKQLRDGFFSDTE